MLSGVAALICGCNSTSGYFANQSGSSQYRRGDFAAASVEFQRAVADDPNNADYVHNLAKSLKKQGRVVEAEQTYRQAMNLDPGHQPSYHSLAVMLNEQGRGGESMAMMQTWVDSQPKSAAAHIEMGWLQRQTGNVIASEESLRRALEVQPNHPIALAHMGQLYEESGQVDRAAGMYRRSLHNHWYQPEVQSKVAAIRGSQPQYGSSVFATQTVAYGAPMYGMGSTTIPSGSAHTYHYGTHAMAPIGSSHAMIATPGYSPSSSAAAHGADPAHADPQ